MNIRRYKLIFIAALIAYSFLMAFHPLLHSHGFDAKDHDDCLACQWDQCVQIISNTPEILFIIVFLIGLLSLHSASCDRIVPASFSTRAPPVPA